MSKNQKDKVVLSYGDSIIRESDMKLLNGPHWLNDRIITFYFEYLYEQEFQGCSKIAFISPEVSQFLKMAGRNEVEIFLEPLNLIEKELIVMAVNNSQDPDRPGGSHWSLLMYSCQAKQFFHFDSSGRMNSDSAQQLSNRIHAYLQKLSNNCNLGNTGYNNTKCAISSVNLYQLELVADLSVVLLRSKRR